MKLVRLVLLSLSLCNFPKLFTDIDVLFCSNAPFFFLLLNEFDDEQVLDEIEQRNRVDRAQERHRCEWHDHRFLSYYFLRFMKLLRFRV